MLLLSVIVPGVVILHAVRELVVRMCHVVVIMMAVLPFPSHLVSLAYHGSVEMLERVRVAVSLYLPVQQHRHHQNGCDKLAENG